MKNVIILGDGFVGSQLSEYFEKKNIQHCIYSKARFDYTQKDDFKSFLTNIKDDIKCIVNCSGYTGSPNVDACETNKQTCWNLNVQYPLNIANICSNMNVPYIHVGSGCIYSGYDKVYTEEDEPDFGLYSNESSFYSKCKDAFEKLIKGLNNCYVFRIRIPFTDTLSSKNYFMKLLKYNTLINELNSVTSIKDFNVFVEKFIDKIDEMRYGVYNVVNTQPVKAEEIIKLFKDNGIENKLWSFIETKNLNTVAKRSNCVLSTDKIKSLGLELPETFSSLKRDIELLKVNFKS